ncbi:polysaccharide deacetylase family protein [Aquiflexum sp. TKW24L]|uniref:polysaccharide deacetylase family protein n=1 Tax=Aquiflexum sp. TKW24L TaxID=2942212 RepID=UPI0020BDC053|nr:polysaccharide deacetylase family protein [Aquiflexum sp. TKW24L]MCL6260435.1 polysaccharide deacetylase family protein [Aquiflexum sp. TKW24L]
MKFKNTVINFHVIKNSNWMERIFILLKKHYKFVSLSDLEDFYYHDIGLKNACHITVDDGDISVYTHLFPIIKKYQIPISIYVSPLCVKAGENFWFQEIVGYDFKKLFEYFSKVYAHEAHYEGKHQLYAVLKQLPIEELIKLIDSFRITEGIEPKSRMGLNLEQLLELKASGLVEIGAHTYKHPILANEDNQTVTYEIGSCILELEEMIGEKVKWFAYPNGIPSLDFSKREMEILRESGIKLAFSTENKRFSKSDDPLSVPRTGISKGNIPFIFAKLFFGSRWDILKGLFNSNKELEIRKKMVSPQKIS